MISIFHKSVIFGLLLYLYTGFSLAEDNPGDKPPEDIRHIQVSGLLGAKVLLVVDGKQYVLPAGSTTPEEIKVISIEIDGAVLEVNGVQEFYALGSSRIATAYTKPDTVAERVYKDVSGMYRTVGTINGLPINFLIDTGATTVAMNRNEAKRLGINYLLNGTPTLASTASGVVKTYKIKLNSVSIGQIKMTNIDAMVVDGDSPSEVLLGMSFLGRLNVQHQNEIMVLETKR